MTSTHAAGIRAARAARVRSIRHRVIAGAVALFVATWLLITLMLVTGHDPALASQTKTKSAVTQTSQTVTSNATTNPTTSSNSSTNTATSTTGATSSSTGSSGNSSSAVTSRQS